MCYIRLYLERGSFAGSSLVQLDQEIGSLDKQMFVDPFFLSISFHLVICFILMKFCKRIGALQKDSSVFKMDLAEGTPMLLSFDRKGRKKVENFNEFCFIYAIVNMLCLAIFCERNILPGFLLSLAKNVCTRAQEG